MKNFYVSSIQMLIQKLKNFWNRLGCTLIPSYDLPIGAATYHILTSLNMLKKPNLALAYYQSCRRPGDGRYGLPTNKLQQYHQFQVVIKPIPSNIQHLYLKSLITLGIDIQNNDISFLEDNWMNPTLGAWGIGWEIRLNSLEITQFTYFKQMCGLECSPSAVEITYGIERLAMILQNNSNIYNLAWGKHKSLTINYCDLFFLNEKSQSKYNFDYADKSFLYLLFKSYLKEAERLIDLEKDLLIPAYEHTILAIHNFNILESRHFMSHSLRQSLILKISKIIKKIAIRYIKL